MAQMQPAPIAPAMAPRPVSAAEEIMAQMQPQGGQKPEAISNVLYDVVTELSDCGRAVDALDEYIDDAREENAPEVARVFEQMRQDEMRHCDMLRDILRTLVQQGKL